MCSLLYLSVEEYIRGEYLTLFYYLLFANFCSQYLIVFASLSHTCSTSETQLPAISSSFNTAVQNSETPHLFLSKMSRTGQRILSLNNSLYFSQISRFFSSEGTSCVTAR